MRAISQILPLLTAVLVGVLVAILAGCSPGARTPSQSTLPGTTKPSKALFEDRALPAGINFKHDSGARGQFLIVESTAPGCAFFDYDNDHFLDVLLIQSGPTPGSGNAKRPHCALYRNNRNGTFSNVTAGSGLDTDLGYAQGVAVGDYDNDGYDDLFITAYGGNHLFRNRGGRGWFEDATVAQGLNKVHGTGYATSAAWGDYDNDGRLDLYVCHYFKWTPAINRQCRNQAGLLDYCSPLVYQPEGHRLYRNSGRGFVDVSRRAGIEKSNGRGLAVAFVDYNADGRQDIFVANDVTPNMLWRNEGNGTFKDVAVETGCAFGENGRAMAGMGIAISDYNRSGRESFYVTNFSSRPNIIFKNVGGLFEEASEETRVGESHLKFLSFGCEFFDYDADGWSDVIVNNGHVAVHEPQREHDIPYRQRKQLLRNQGNATFREITDEALLGDLVAPHVGRGLATGDYDNDGRIDVLAGNQNGAAQLLHNRAQSAHHWVSFATRGTKSNRDGLHARLEIKAGGARRIATVRAGSSYLSHSDRRVYFGLGNTEKIDELVIRWPSGTRDVHKNLRADMFYTVTEGSTVAPVQLAKP